MPIDYENNRDLARRIAEAQSSTIAGKYADAFNWVNNLNAQRPFIGPGTYHWGERFDRKIKNDKLFYEPGDWAVRWKEISYMKHRGISSMLNSEGDLEVFGINDGGDIWCCKQKKEKDYSAYFDVCGGIGREMFDSFSYPNEKPIKVRTVASAKNEDGRLEVFALGNDLSLHNMWQKWPSGQWSNWNNLGGGN